MEAPCAVVVSLTLFCSASFSASYNLIPARAFGNGIPNTNRPSKAYQEAANMVETRGKKARNILLRGEPRLQGRRRLAVRPLERAVLNLARLTFHQAASIALPLGRFTSDPVHSRKGRQWAIGIKNHGNTCWFNSLIQAVLRHPRVGEYFLREHRGDNGLGLACPPPCPGCLSRNLLYDMMALNQAGIDRRAKALIQSAYKRKWFRPLFHDLDFPLTKL